MLPSGVLNKAIKEANKSNMPVFRIGAVVFKGNRILSSGHNSKGFCGKIHPKYRNIRDSVHAEQSAILGVKDWSKLKGTSIITIRITRTGIISMAKPCEMCMSMIRYTGIKEIYYSNHNGEIVREEI